MHLLKGDYRIDSRVRNETESLIDHYEVHVFCFNEGLLVDDCREELRNDVKIRYFLIGSSLVGKLKAWLKIRDVAQDLNPVLIHAHDLQSLPLGFLLAKKIKAKLIYDSHELWSQAHHQPRFPGIVKVAKLIERFFAKRVDAVITVSDSIAKFLSNYFNHHHVHVIRNVPTYMRPNICADSVEKLKLRKKLGLADDDVLFLYQGLIKRERGVFLIADSLKYISDKRIVLLYLGSGSDLEELKAYTDSLAISSHVRFQDSVPQDKLALYTSSCDVGVHAIQNTCLNHDYCLPNKLFEYLQCGKPVVVSDLTEMKRFVCEYKLGLVFRDGDANSLAKALTYLLDEKIRNRFSESVERNCSEFSSDVEYGKLLTIYSEVLDES